MRCAYAIGDRVVLHGFPGMPPGHRQDGFTGVVEHIGSTILTGTTDDGQPWSETPGALHPRAARHRRRHRRLPLHLPLPALAARPRRLPRPADRHRPRRYPPPRGAGAARPVRHDLIGAPRTVTTTQPRTSLRNVRRQDPDPHLVDARTLRAIREHLDREEHGGATVVRIEHLRALLWRPGR